MEVESSSPAESEPSPALRYKQRLEKSSGGEAVLMEWSPTMDLLAIALSDHSVSSTLILLTVHLLLSSCCCLVVKVVLNRLSWQRVWMIGPESAAATAMAWRPDGRGKVENP